MTTSHAALFALHQDWIRVSDGERARLRELRDINVQRLLSGLDALGVDRPRSHPGQGSYAMNTLTQRDDGDQDLDVALIFDESALPRGARAARDLVHDAVLAVAPRGFQRQPERRTNAVTVWYSAGFHIDFAIYRQRGKWVEHAGARWTQSDPGALLTWFRDANDALSPTWRPGAQVRDSQLRRIVRFLKWLRHGDDETYPGGFVITALAVRCFQPSPTGDDIALRNTMDSMVSALDSSLDVRHPLQRRKTLVPRQKDTRRLGRYRSLLRETLEPLQGRRPRVAAWEAALGVDL